MEFDKLKTEIKAVEFDMTRGDNEDYFEAVVKKSSLEGLINILKDNFGSQAWPSKVKLSKYAEKVVNDFGGIRKGQTLYFSNNDGHPIFAMLWPWQDKEHTTLKLALIKKLNQGINRFMIKLFVNTLFYFYNSFFFT